ncbi:MAG: tetratricopeptide repeat protein [Bacteroidales bacterium]
MRKIFFLLIIAAILGNGCAVFQKSSDSEDEEAAIDTSVHLTEDDKLAYQYAFIEGVREKTIGNSSKALAYFNKCLEIDEDAAAPRYEISQISTMMDEKKAAIRYGKEAVKLDPENKYYKEHLAQLFIEDEDYKNATEQFEALIKIDNRNVDYFYTLAQLYNQLGKKDKAVHALDSVETRVGVNEELSLMKKALYEELGEKEKAVDEVEKLIKLNPQESEYYGILAELYTSFQDFEKAEEMYNELFQLDSTNNMGKLSRIQYYTQKGQQDKAIELFKEMIPNEDIEYGNKLLIFINFLENQQTVNTYKNILQEALDKLAEQYPDKYENNTLYADFYLKTNQFEKASEALEKLINISNERYIYRDQLVSIYSYLGEIEKMYEVGKEGLKKYDNKPRMNMLTAMAAIQLEKSEEALEILEDGLAYLDKDNEELTIDYYTQLAEAYHNTGDFEKSEYYFDKVLDIDSENILVLNNYSYYLSIREKKLDKALKMSRKAIEQEPDNPTYLDTYAWVLYKKEKYEKAEKYIEKAIQHGGHDDPDIVEHYGDILFKNSQEERAIKQWRKAQTLGNDSDELERKIENKDISSEGKN